MPPPPYIKEPGGGGGRSRRARQGGSPTPTGSRSPFFPSWNRTNGEEEEEGKERGGAAPLPLSYSDWGGGARGPALASSPLFHLCPLRPIKLPGGSGNLRYSGKIPISPGTLPISKYRLPIYQSLCLVHFETPRHVRDHIRDSEQPSVHQNI